MLSRYRLLRGMVIHVLPVLRRGRFLYGRKLIDLGDLYNTGCRRKYRCRWCHLPVSNRRRSYCDDDCQRQLHSVLGYRVFPTTWSLAKCVQCGQPWSWEARQGLEVDHELPIFRARKLGHKAMIAAFLLDNLRWLCRECHRQKTTADIKQPNVHRDELQPQLF